MAGHTKGPWRWTDGENDIDISTYESPGYYDNPTLKGAVEGFEGDIIGCSEYDILYGKDHEQRVANARLIAAAPELLEALQDLLGVIDAAGLINLSNGVQLGQTVWFVKASDAVNYASAAIAKATQT